MIYYHSLMIFRITRWPIVKWGSLCLYPMKAHRHTDRQSTNQTNSSDLWRTGGWILWDLPRFSKKGGNRIKGCSGWGGLDRRGRGRERDLQTPKISQSTIKLTANSTNKFLNHMDFLLHGDFMVFLVIWFPCDFLVIFLLYDPLVFPYFRLFNGNP